MPSQTSAVGPLTLPVPAGALGDKFDDPVVEALLDYAAFSLNDNLNAKLANLAQTPSTAVPAANRFTFDPTHPRGHSVTLPIPSLYVWWDGQSTIQKWSLLVNMRVREIQFMYVFDELPELDEMDRRAGLLNAVDAIMHKVSFRSRHPSYGFDGAPLGQSLCETLGPLGSFHSEWMGGQPGRFGIDEGPDEAASRRVKKISGRDYPALRGRWNVMERVHQETLEDPADVNRDIAVTLNASDGESADTTLFMDRVLGGPDGCEGDDE